MSRVQALKKQFEQNNKDKHSSQISSPERINELKSTQRRSSVQELISQHSQIIQEVERERLKFKEEEEHLTQIREKRNSTSINFESVQNNKDKETKIKLQQIVVDQTQTPQVQQQIQQIEQLIENEKVKTKEEIQHEYFQQNEDNSNEEYELYQQQIDYQNTA